MNQIDYPEALRVGLDPAFSARLDLALADMAVWVEKHRPGAVWRVYETLRTKKRQLMLVATGKSKTLRSKHIVGRAADSVLVHNGKAIWNDSSAYAYWGHCCRKQGLTWGGDWARFVDKPHCEL